jgi:hypothetical protein
MLFAATLMLCFDISPSSPFRRHFTPMLFAFFLRRQIDILADVFSFRRSPDDISFTHAMSLPVAPPASEFRRDAASSRQVFAPAEQPLTRRPQPSQRHDGMNTRYIASMQIDDTHFLL